MTFEELKAAAYAKSLMKASMKSPNVRICLVEMLDMSSEELKRMFMDYVESDKDITGKAYYDMQMDMRLNEKEFENLEGYDKFFEDYKKIDSSPEMNLKTIRALSYQIRTVISKDESKINKKNEDLLVTILIYPLNKKDLVEKKEAIIKFIKNY